TAVTVNLATGAATGVGGTVSGIQVVIGGIGNNTLTGDNNGDVLVGNGASNTIIGGSGRNILIGSGASDTVTAGSADDILIGNKTSYDANAQALLAILAEWQSADDYTTRIGKI